MFPPPTEPTNPADEAEAYTASQQAERTERQLQALDRLMQLGMGMAEQVHHQAQHHAMATIAGGKPSPDFTAAFERAARTVRRTVLMAQHVAKPQPERVFRRTAARKPVIHAAEDATQREAGNGGEASSPRAERVERLDRLDRLDQLDCLDDKDPGFGKRRSGHPRTRRAPDDPAALCVQAEAPPCTSPGTAASLPRPQPPRAWAGAPPTGPGGRAVQERQRFSSA